ncbi:unnamed protein product [Chrysoparadoxa australica]
MGLLQCFLLFFVSSALAFSARSSPRSIPKFRRVPAVTPTDGKPILLFLPGVEGLGISGQGQFGKLQATYDVHQLILDRADRSTFADLTKAVLSFLCSSPMPAIVVGESFGAVLALGVALAEPDSVERLFLVNPATSFPRTAWPILGQVLANTDDRAFTAAGLAAFIGLIPDAAQVGDVIGTLLDPRKKIALRKRPAALVDRLRYLWGEIGQVSENLPPETLRWRLRYWLGSGCAKVDDKLADVKVPVTVIAGTADRMLPSVEEARRLASLIPVCNTVILKGHGHASLFDDRFNLHALILKTVAGDGVKKSTPHSPRQKQLVELYEGNYVDAFTPPDDETISTGRSVPHFLRRPLSPVYLSTKADGSVVSGLGAIPDKDPNKPVLFVGNHQTLAMDISLVVDGIYKEKGMLVRGLAHPVLLLGQGAPQPLGDLIKDWMTTFGAVPVSGRNMHRLFQRNECVLLFPGGAKEAYHRRGEEHQMFWPERSEFVRMAAHFNATIIPFSAVGLADSLDMILDADQMINLPLVGRRLKDNAEELLSARREEQKSELFLAPLMRPKAPQRVYFKFGRPFETEDLSKSNRSECDALYKEVGEEVQRGMEMLLAAREQDEMASNAVKRMAWEALNGNGCQNN